MASDLLAARLRKAGIDVLFNDEVRVVHPGPRGVAGVTLASGRSLPCELVAAALGVLPNSEFLANTGVNLAPERRGRREQPAAELDRQCLGRGRCGERRWRVAGAVGAGALAGARGRTKYAGGSALHQPGAHYFATRLFDLDFARLGQIERREGREELIDFPREPAKSPIASW